MNNLYSKTIVFINLRFADYYSKDLFSQINARKNVRMVAILDQQFQDRIPAHLAENLDAVYELKSNPKMGFLGEFDYQDLRNIIEAEKRAFNEIVIVCSDEFNLLNAGKLRAEFSLYGHKDDYLSIYRDKVKMKERLQHENIRVPKFKLLHQADDYESLQEYFSTPFVIKPIDSCGSHGVCVIKNKNDYLHCVQDLNGDFEVEEFIAGKLYHVDSLMKDGELQFICANEYTFPNYEYTKGKPLGSIPLDASSDLGNRLIDFAKRSLLALGADNIINHMELFVSHANEIIFLEVSGRPPGALLNLTHRVNFGINLMDEDFVLQTNMDVSVNVVQRHLKAFFALFPLLPGRVMKMLEPDVESMVDFNWHVSKDDIISAQQCQNIVGKAAHAIFYHHDENTLRRDFEYIKQFQAIEVC